MRPKFILILPILILSGFFLFQNPARADYEAQGTVVSTNLLSSLGDVAQITNFVATTTIPASTTVQAQYSQDQVHWYDSLGKEGYLDTLASGTNTIELRGLDWTTAFFYYRLVLNTTNASVTPTILAVTVNYSSTYTHYVQPWESDYLGEGTVVSTNLLSGKSDVAQIKDFKVDVTLPASTSASVQFSQDNVNWYDSEGATGGFDALSSGANTVELRLLDWQSAFFYYRIDLKSASSTQTPTLNQVEVEYNDTYQPFDTPWGDEVYPEGTVLSTNLLADSGGAVLSGVQRFAYKLVDLPAGASVRAQFSTNTIAWYSATGTPWGWTTLVSGDHLGEFSSLGLSQLGWGGQSSFYYKLEFSAAAGGKAAAIADAGLFEPVMPSAYWSFDEGQGTIVHDGTVNGNNGTSSGAVWKPDSECVSGKCLGFNGTSSVVSLGAPAPLNNINVKTISAWIKFNTYGEGGLGRIINKEDAAIGGWGLYLDGTSHYLTYFHVFAGATLGKWNSPVNSLSSTSAWHHVAVSYDRTNANNNPTIFIDGVSQSVTRTSIPSGSAIDDSAQPAYIGNRNNYGDFDRTFDGNIDELRIYSYARTADEIKQEYASGLAGMGGSPSSVTIGGGGGDSWLTDGLVGYWKMDESATTSGAIDSSGNGNNGTYYKHASTTGGKYGNGGVFDGADDYVDAGNLAGLNGLSQVSACAWVRHDNLTTDDMIISNHLNTAGIALLRDDVGVLSGRTDTYKFQVHSGSGATFIEGSSNLSVSGAWTHVCGIFRGTDNVELWVNGVRDTAQPYTGEGVANTGNGANNLHIGNSIYAASTEIDGNIDEVRLYNRALSPTEIAKLYEWAPGPVGFWKMDDKVEGNSQVLVDSSGYGNNETTVWGTNASGMDCTKPGKFGSSCSFDGVDDYTTTGDIFYSDALTVCTWFKSFKNIGDISTTYTLVAKRNLNILAHDNEWALYTEDGSVSFSSWNAAGAGAIWINGGVILSPNVWYHACAVQNGNGKTGYLYINGILRATSTQTSVMKNTDSEIEFGVRTSDLDVRYWPGQIDDVRIYNYARTPKQIIEDMNAGQSGNGQIQPPIVYYKFDEGFGSTAYNSGLGCTDILKCAATKGILNASGSGGNTTETQMWDLNGKTGKAVEFDGTNDNVSMDGQPYYDTKGAGTVSMWVKPNSTSTAYGLFQTYEDRDKYIYTYQGKFGVSVFDGSTFRLLEGGSVTTDWQYVAYSWDNQKGDISLYINGTLTGSNDSSAWTTVIRETGTFLGNASDQSVNGMRVLNYFNGRIDDFKLYNYLLTDADVKADFNAGSAAYLGSAGTASTTGKSTNAAGGEYCVPGSTDFCAAPVGEWKMNEKVKGNGKTIHDTSGNGNDGTAFWGANASGMDCSKPGKVGASCSFDGADDYVEKTSASGLPTTQGNFSMWVYLNVYPQTPYAFPFVELSDGTANNRLVFYIDFQHTYFYAIGGGSGTNVWDGASTEISTKRWNHIAANWNTVTDTYQVYVNGRLATPASTNTAGNPVGLNQVNFGSYYSHSAGNFHNGLIDNVRIYNYARTPAQIAWEYNQGQPVAEWRFNECQGATIHDNSGNGGNGTIHTTLTFGTCSASANTNWYNGRLGKYGGSLDFPGYGNYVDMGDYSLHEPAAITLSAWALPDSVDDGFIISKESDACDQRFGYVMRGNSASQGYYCRFGIGASSLDTPIIPIRGGGWQHLLCTYDGSSAKMYVNGKLGGQTNGSIVINYTGVNIVRVGGHLCDPAASFLGKLDEVKIFNYALTAEQVKQLYNNSSVVNFQ